MDYRKFDGFMEPDSDKSVLRDSRGRCRTQNLFYETKAWNENYKPLYSLKEFSKEYPSAYQIYMNSADETEAALKLVGSLYHWNMLCELKWFTEGYSAYSHMGLLTWRKHMEERDKSLAKKTLLKAAAEGSTMAAKTLLGETKEKEKEVKRKRIIVSKEDGSNVLDFGAELDKLGD